MGENITSKMTIIDPVPVEETSRYPTSRYPNSRIISHNWPQWKATPSGKSNYGGYNSRSASMFSNRMPYNATNSRVGLPGPQGTSSSGSYYGRGKYTGSSGRRRI